MMQTIKNKNYDDIIHLLFTHARRVDVTSPQSLLTMDDDAFKYCYENCMERHLILHERPFSIDLRKKTNYIFKYELILPLEYYLSSYITCEKFNEIKSILRKRLKHIYGKIQPDDELVFFSTLALGMNTGIVSWPNLFQPDCDRYSFCYSCRHPSEQLSPRELQTHHVFETWPDADWDWTMLSRMPNIATEENVFSRHTNAPWDWYVLSKERTDLVSYENVFLKYAHMPWDWRGLSWHKHLASPENVFVNHPDKPWKHEVLNHHDYWSIPLLEMYHTKFPVKWQILTACNPHLITYENIFGCHQNIIDWNWFAVSACPHVATYENVFIKHPNAPWEWSVLS